MINKFNLRKNQFNTEQKNFCQQKLFCKHLGQNFVQLVVRQLIHDHIIEQGKLV